MPHARYPVIYIILHYASTLLELYGWAGSGMPDIQLLIAGKLDIRPDNPALPYIRPNPSYNSLYIYITYLWHVTHRQEHGDRHNEQGKGHKN